MALFEERTPAKMTKMSKFVFHQLFLLFKINLDKSHGSMNLHLLCMKVLRYQTAPKHLSHGKKAAVLPTITLRQFPP